MSSAVALLPPTAASPVAANPATARPESRHALGFVLFLFVNAALFVRPAEIVPDFVGWNIYEFLILACLAVSLPAVIQQFTLKSLESQPVTVCVLGLLMAMILSLLAQLNLANALNWGIDFSKVVLYYVLFIGLVDSVARLRIFLYCLLVFGAVTVCLAVLEYHGVIALPNLVQIVETVQDPMTGRDVPLVRLTGSGIFHDPNEVGVLTSALIVLGLYWLTDRRSGPLRLLWVAPLILFLYAMNLTQSRGAFLALMAGLAVLLVARFGWRVAVLAGVVVLPALVLLLAGRQTDLSTSDGTAQDRIQIWSDAFFAMRQSPLFGVGRDLFAKQERLVAHNSYLQCFVELGVFGGILFLGAYYLVVSQLWRLADRRKHKLLDPEAARLYPYIFGLIAAWGVGMLSLTLCYILPTYTILAVATTFSRNTPVNPPLPVQRFDLRLLGRLLTVAVVGFGALYLFVRLSLVR